MEYVLQAANSRTSLSFAHASSGNPGGIRTGPPIKAFGADDLGESHLFPSAAIFEGEREVYLFFTPELGASRAFPAKFSFCFDLIL